MELRKGHTFTYLGRSWKITESYKIEWNDNSISNEFKIKSDEGVIKYLEILTNGDNNTSLSFWSKEYDKDFIYKAQNTDNDYIAIGNARFPKKVNLKGINYNFITKHTGTCQYGFSNSYEKERVDSIDYKNENNSKLLSIELWDDEIEVSTGIPIKESELKNIEKGIPPITVDLINNWFNKNLMTILILGIILISFLLNRCNQSNSWNSNDSISQNDSTKVHRSNNPYRGRTSYGFGK